MKANIQTGQNCGLRLGELVLRALKEAGAEEVFGIPGDFVLPFFKVVEQTGLLKLYTLSHEPSVGFAADGAARWSCRPSVAAVTYGAGALNIVNTVAAAYAEKSPVVVISGGPAAGEKHTELLLHHQAKRLDSQFQIFREVTCAQTRLKNPATAHLELGRVLTQCVCQSRPVYIELPRDCVDLVCQGRAGITKTPSFDPDALDACVDDVLQSLSNASSPVLMVGVEVRRFGLENQSARLAQQLGFPVVTSFMGRGLLAGTPAPVFGTYLGIAGDNSITGMVEDSDGLFLLGVICSDTNLGISKRRIDLRKCILANEGQVRLGHHFYPNIPLGTFVQRLSERLPAAGARSPTSRPVPARPEHMRVDDQAVSPDDLARGINDLLGRFGQMQIVTDVGDCMFLAMQIENTAHAAPGYYASMGFAVPAGLGIQAVSGQRPLILVGDGGFRMTGWELGSCRRYGWDPIVVVLNNSSWEMLRVFEPESKFNELDEWNFSRLADDLGGHGQRVRTRRQFSQALAAAHAQRGQFQLIEAMLDRGNISSTMSRFVSGIKRFQDSKPCQRTASNPSRRIRGVR